MNNYHIYGHNYDFQEFDEPILQEYSTKKKILLLKILSLKKLIIS